MSQECEPLDGGGGVVDDVLHFWLLWPLQVHRMTAVPLAVPAPLTSRHRPDLTPVTEPSEFCRHCWLAWPLQVQMITGVPGVVWPLEASTQRVSPIVLSSPAEVKPKAWLAWLSQSQMSRVLPGVSTLPLTSRHRPEAELTSGAAAADAGTDHVSAVASIVASSAITQAAAAVGNRCLLATALRGETSEGCIVLFLEYVGGRR